MFGNLAKNAVPSPSNTFWQRRANRVIQLETITPAQLAKQLG
jgi:hypothetical protein